MGMTWDNVSKCVDTTLAEYDTPTAVKIGGKSGKFVPNINASKWDDRAWLNINFPETVTTQTPVFENGVSQIVLNGWTHKYYVKPNGNLEYDIILDKKPADNKITLNLTFPEGLDFWYQDSLENDWKIDHHGCKTLEEFLAASDRPENVVGSYAVYWKEKNNAFKTGKFCHIYRPLVSDSGGKTVWADLAINTNEKTLTITVPQSWLDSATYPVIIDPELGYSTNGAGSYGGGFILGGAYTTDASGGNITAFHAFNSSVVGGEGKIAVSETNGSNDPSGQDLMEQVTLTLVADSQNDEDASGTVTLAGSTQYWVGGVSVNGTGWKYDSGSSNKYCKFSGVVYGDQFVDPMSTGYSTDTYQYSIWVDYEAAAEKVLAGSVSAASSTSSFLPYIYHTLINNVVTGASSIGTLMMYRFHNLINNTVSAVSSIGNPVMYLYRYLINNTVNAVSTTAGNLTIILAAVYHALAGAVSALSSTSQMLMERWRYLINNAVTSASSIGNALPYITRRLLPDTVDIVSSLIGNLEELGSDVYQALAGAVEATSSFIGNLYVQTYEFLSGAVEAAASLTGNLWVYGIRTLTGAVNAVATTYGNLSGSIGGALNKLRIYMKIHRGRF